MDQYPAEKLVIQSKNDDDVFQTALLKAGVDCKLRPLKCATKSFINTDNKTTRTPTSDSLTRSSLSAALMNFRHDEQIPPIKFHYVPSPLIFFPLTEKLHFVIRQQE